MANLTSLFQASKQERKSPGLGHPGCTEATSPRDPIPPATGPGKPPPASADWSWKFHLLDLLQIEAVEATEACSLL